MLGEDLRTEEEKKAAERISEYARERAKQESFRAFLEHLQKELQKILPEKTVKYRTKLSPSDLFDDGEFPKVHAERETESKTRFPNICSFEESDTKYALGIFPRHISKRILDTSPVALETFHCVVYDANALPILKESVARFAEILHIKNLTIKKKYDKGNLSLATQGGELSTVTQQTGKLTIVEK